jgi:hypothetical protein
MVGTTRMIVTVLVAIYFSVLVPGQNWPLLVGPYLTWEDCDVVRGWLDRRGYETDACASMPWPQEAVLLGVLDLP